MTLIPFSRLHKGYDFRKWLVSTLSHWGMDEFWPNLHIGILWPWVYNRYSLFLTICMFKLVGGTYVFLRNHCSSWIKNEMIFYHISELMLPTFKIDFMTIKTNNRPSVNHLYWILSEQDFDLHFISSPEHEVLKGAIEGQCPSCIVRRVSSVVRYQQFAGLSGSVGCALRLETRRSRVRPTPSPATFFHGDWSWNIFYGHCLPSADSKRAVVSFWRKNVHNTG